MSLPTEHGGTVFAVARELGLAAADLTDFSASINPLGISPAVRAAIAAAIADLTHYPDTSHWELKQSLARYHGLPPERFAVANGSTELIYKLPALFSGSVLIVAPAFSEYARAAAQQHLPVDYFRLDPSEGFALDLKRLERELPGHGALFLCNPGNPSGTLYPLATVAAVADLCRRHGVFLVLDEAFMDFSESDSAKSLFHDTGGIILRSMTKFFGFPGLRLGYAIGGEETVRRLDATGGPWSVNTLAMAAGLAALQDRDHNAATIACVTEQRQRLTAALEAHPCFRTYPSPANFILVEIVGNRLTAGELQARLLERRILIRNCANFEGLSERFFRVAVRSGEENSRLEDALGRVLRDLC